jgi:hypothetical protein
LEINLKKKKKGFLSFIEKLIDLVTVNISTCWINLCNFTCLAFYPFITYTSWIKGCCGHDSMVVGYTTTYEISAYHH